MYTLGYGVNIKILGCDLSILYTLNKNIYLTLLKELLSQSRILEEYKGKQCTTWSATCAACELS